MKLVVAIVRTEKLTDVLEALFHADVRGLTINRVQGHGGETEHVETYRGTTMKMALSDKVRLDIGVPNHFLDPTCKAILTSAGQLAASAQAAPSTHSPSATIAPVSSASGMKSAGEIRPRAGWCQRNSASKPLIS